MEYKKTLVSNTSNLGQSVNNINAVPVTYQAFSYRFSLTQMCYTQTKIVNELASSNVNEDKV